MLPERTFQLGSWICFILGALLLGGFFLLGAPLALFGFLVGGALFLFFGMFFWHVGAEARRDRLQLLAMGEFHPPEGAAGSSGSRLPKP